VINQLTGYSGESAGNVDCFWGGTISVTTHESQPDGLQMDLKPLFFAFSHQFKAAPVVVHLARANC
jgi:hypothetical protein